MPDDWRERLRQEEERRRRELAAAPVVALRGHAAIDLGDEGRALITAAIGSRGQLLTLWADDTGGAAAATAATTSPGRATFPASKPPRPVSARIVELDPTPVRETRLAELPVAHPHLDALPGGGYLVVGSRCRWRPDGPEENAWIVDGDGHLQRSGTLGDGIEHMGTTPAGQVWVGYSDEGIFGNYGWGSVGGPPPIGWAGLVRFDDGLEPVWRFPTDLEAGAIADCYALNVVGEEAWACYYTDWPIVQVRGDGVVAWRNDVDGASAMLVDDGTVVLVGGYPGARERLAIGRLGAGSVDWVGVARLAGPDGDEPPTGTLVGRADQLHLVTSHGWFKLDVDDVRRAVG